MNLMKLMNKRLIFIDHLKAIFQENFGQQQQWQKIRYLSSNKNLRPIDDLSSLNDDTNMLKPREKTPPQEKIYLRDEKNRLLGLMTKIQAEKLAQKHKKLLIESDGPAKKIPTMKLIDPRTTNDGKDDKEILNEQIDDEDLINELDNLSINKRKSSQPKVIHFTSKVSEHDLQIKINHVKKFLLRGHETMVKITSPTVNTADQDAIKSELEQIFTEFDRIFNDQNGCRINQKRLTGKELKFNILITDHEEILKKFSSQSIGSTSTDPLPKLDQIDPNQLLNDNVDMENILDRIKKQNKDQKK